MKRDNKRQMDLHLVKERGIINRMKSHIDNPKINDYVVLPRKVDVSINYIFKKTVNVPKN